MKKLLTFIFLSAVIFIFSLRSYSQTLSFSEDIADDGTPIRPNTTFNIVTTGGYIYFLVNTISPLNSKSVKFDIYKIDNSGKEILDNSFSQNTELTWHYFYNKVTFYEAGTYKIYVYDKGDHVLTSANVNIQ